MKSSIKAHLIEQTLEDIKLPLFLESARQADYENINMSIKLFLNRSSGLNGQIRSVQVG